MTKEVKYLKQIVAHLEKKYGSEKAQAIMDKAWKRYDELVEENKDEPKAYYTHTRQRIYPGVSMFDAMIDEGISREETVEFITSYSAWRAQQMAPIVRKIMKIPGIYRKVPKFFYKMTAKSFGPHMGFVQENGYVSTDEMRFDMVKCPYQDMCTKYGCPEIVKGYCNGDDILYGNMHPRLSWDRTKTLGHGDDVCNFKIHIKEK